MAIDPHVNPADDEAMLRWFEFGQLSPNLAEIAQLFATLAADLVGLLPPGRERSAGLRKLLEAKDCFVRARIEGGS